MAFPTALHQFGMPRPARAVFPLLLYLLVAILLFADVWQSPATKVVGIGPDPQLSIWFLRWVPFALSQGLNPFLSDYVGYPQGVNLMWNTSFPLLGLLLTPATITFGTALSYNLMATLALSVSAWCAYLAIYRYVRSPMAAAAGGLLYGFSPYMVGQSLGHPQLTVAFFPPLLLLLLDEILIRQRQRAAVMGILLGLLATAQLLVGEEVLAMSAIAGLLGILLLIAADPGAVRRHAPHAVRTLAAASLVFLLVAAWPLSIQFFGPHRPEGPLQVQDFFVTDLLGFFVPTRLQQLGPTWAIHLSDHFSGNLAEWNAYLGLPLIVLLVFTAVRFRRSYLVRATTLLGLVLVLLSMGRTLHVGGQSVPIAVPLLALSFVPLKNFLPLRWVIGIFLPAWVALAAAPILDNVLPGRLMLYVFLLAGILLAVFVDWLMASSDPRRLLVGGLATLIALAPLFPKLPFPSTPISVPAFFSSPALSQIPDGSVVLVAPSYQGYATAMLWQADAGMRFRIPQGYLIRPDQSPTVTESLIAKIQLEEDLPPVTDELRQQVRDDLQRWQVGTVIVGPMPREAQTVQLFTELFREWPSRAGGVHVWRR